MIFKFLRICALLTALFAHVPVSANSPVLSLQLNKNLALFSYIFLTAIMIFFAYKMLNMKKQSERDKMTDSDTGIGNLLHFEQNFEKYISAKTAGKCYISYIIIDSNYLHVYHKNLPFSDVLKYTAKVLTKELKDDEIVARISETGFSCVFKAPSSEAAQKRVESIIENLNSYSGIDKKSSKPVFHVALYHLSEADLNCQFLLFNLRRNCSKTIGTDTEIVLCDLHSMNSAIEEKCLFESFTKAFDNREFKLYLQFIVDNKTKKLVSAEALSRWEKPEEGLIFPGKYIEALESVGMITKLDFYMFENVCMQLQKWKNTDFSDISISCNFTRLTISEDNFIENIKQISNKYDFDRSKLIIEITEDAIEKNLDVAMANVNACKEMGFAIALDDMGCGYTSLINLCDYPIDIVKIDREILLKTNKQNGKQLFNGIIALSHSLNLKVVCEGVETKEQNELVSSSNCDLIQGWYYSKACPVSVSEDFILGYSQTA